MDYNIKINDAPLTFPELATLMVALQRFQEQLHGVEPMDDQSKAAKQTYLRCIGSLNATLRREMGI